MTRTVRKAVFPVAGLGTRFLPATKAIPKEMLPVVDKPVIQYGFEEAIAAGVEHFIFVTSRGKTALEDHFDRHFELEETLARRGKTAELEALHKWQPRLGQVSFVRQPEPLGLGHAVLCAKDLVGDEPFAVLLPDDVVQAAPSCLAQMVAAYPGGNMLAVMDVPREQTRRYGVLAPGRRDGALVEITGLVEKPDPAEAPSTLSVIGRYILDGAIFGYLERQERGAGGEIQLTDAIARMIGTMPSNGFQFAGRRFDCGDRLGFLEANIAFAAADPALGPAFRALLKRYAREF